MPLSILDALPDKLTQVQELTHAMLDQLCEGLAEGDLKVVDQQIRCLTSLLRLCETLDIQIARWRTERDQTRYTSYDDLPPPSPEDQLRIRADLTALFDSLYREEREEGERRARSSPRAAHPGCGPEL